MSDRPVCSRRRSSAAPRCPLGRQGGRRRQTPPQEPLSTVSGSSWPCVPCAVGKSTRPVTRCVMQNSGPVPRYVMQNSRPVPRCLLTPPRGTAGPSRPPSTVAAGSLWVLTKPSWRAGVLMELQTGMQKRFRNPIRASRQERLPIPPRTTTALCRAQPPTATSLSP